MLGGAALELKIAILQYRTYVRGLRRVHDRNGFRASGLSDRAVPHGINPRTASAACPRWGGRKHLGLYFGLGFASKAFLIAATALKIALAIENDTPVLVASSSSAVHIHADRLAICTT